MNPHGVNLRYVCVNYYVIIHGVNLKVYNNPHYLQNGNACDSRKCYIMGVKVH